MDNPIHYRCECGWFGDDPDGIATTYKICPICAEAGKPSVARPFVIDQRPGWVNWLPIDITQPLVIGFSPPCYSVPVTVEGRPSYVRIQSDALALALTTWRQVAQPYPRVQVVGVGKRALQLLAELAEEEP